MHKLISDSSGNVFEDLGRPFAEEKKLKAKWGIPQIPKTIGAAVDALYSTKKLRLEIQKEVEQLAKFEAELKEHLIQILPKSDSTGAAGNIARASITRTDVPVVEDWDALYAHVRKTKDFSLLQRRLTNTAVTERWDAGKEVPGVGKFTVVGISVNKL